MLIQVHAVRHVHRWNELMAVTVTVVVQDMVEALLAQHGVKVFARFALTHVKQQGEVRFCQKC